MKTVKERNSQGRYLSVRPNVVHHIAPEFIDKDYTPVVPYTESTEKMNRQFLKPVDLSYKRHYCKECLKLSIIIIFFYKSSCACPFYLSFIYIHCVGICLRLYEILLSYHIFSFNA